MVDAPAEVHVTAFDPSLRGEAARIGRWDFSPAETASFFCRTVNGGAIHLAMGWPDARRRTGICKSTCDT